MQTIQLDPKITTTRIFREGNLYPDDLNLSQRIFKTKFDQIFSVCINPGILSNFSPETNTGPLAVRINSNLVSINAGSAIFKNGYILDLRSPLEVLFDPKQEELIYDYILLLRQIEDVTFQSRYNFATEQVEPVELGIRFELQLHPLSDYQLFSQEELDLSIVLCQLSKQINIGDPTFALSASPIIKRPWFSWEDTQHRSQKGTGRVSSNNPHGMSLLDLESIPGLSYWSLNDLVGIVSTFKNEPNHYGDLVEVTIPNLIIENNVGGYQPATFKLLKGGAHVLSVREGSGTYHNFKYDRVTRTVSVFSPAPISDFLTIKVLVIHAGTVTLQQENEFLLEIEGALENEFMVTDGGVLTNFQGQEFNTQALSGVSNRYDMYVDLYSSLILDPLPIFQTNFDKLGNYPFTEIFLPFTSQLNVALGNFVVPSGLSCKIKIEGKKGGEKVSETLDISNSTFRVPIGTNLINIQTAKIPNQWILTSKSYSSISKIEVESASANLPSHTSLLLTQNLQDRSNLIHLATLEVTNKGTTHKILDTRNQRIGAIKKSSALFQEDFTNPQAFNPETSTFTSDGIYNGIYQSRPIFFPSGTYLLAIDFSTYDYNFPPNVSLTQYDSNDPFQLHGVPFDNNYSKDLYRVYIPNDSYRCVQIVSPQDSGNRLRSLTITMLDKSIYSAGPAPQ